jgi:1-acyl-sn-glycerol-3-phosphate acyltransferase
VCNHLSYVDTQVTDTVLARAGHRELADRLVAVAGPKVYTDAWRRLAALGLNTRKTVQSAAVATEQDALPPRELAAIARDTLTECESLMDRGYVVLLYPEGTRSRDGRLQPFLRAVGRYLSTEGVRVLPLAQTGTEAVFPRDATQMRPRPVRLAFGPPLAPGGNRDEGLARSHAAVAEHLPEAYRPA